jgi:hypothetical protein
MMKKYIKPTSEVFRLSFVLNQRWVDNGGYLGVNSNKVDANVAEGKAADIPGSNDPLWED